MIIYSGKTRQYQEHFGYNYMEFIWGCQGEVSDPKITLPTTKHE